MDHLDRRSVPYSKDVRRRVACLHFLQDVSPSEISRRLGGKPCASTVRTILADYKLNEILEKQGRKGVKHFNRKLDEFAATYLQQQLIEEPSISQADLAAEMSAATGRNWTQQDISRALAELGRVRNVSAKQAVKGDPVRQQEFRDEIAGLGLGPLHFVFIDEVATDSKTTSEKYAWNLKGMKHEVDSLLVRGRRFTSIAAISADGFVGEPLIKEGSADAADFTDWFVEQVLPELGDFLAGGSHSVIVLDSCAVHLKDVLHSICSDTGAHVIFLPPYSPVSNPIELLFSKMKCFLTHNRDLVGELAPVHAIEMAFASITAAECESCIRHIQIYNTPYVPSY